MRDDLLRRLDDLSRTYGRAREQLLPFLQELHTEYGYLGEDIVTETARLFDLSPTEVFSVASFYHFLKTEPCGRHVVRICRTISCDLKNRRAVQRAVEAELGISMGETTPDRAFSLDYANCMGMCDRGPSMMVDDDLYAGLSPSKAVDIINSYR